MASSTLDNVRIARPCSADWDKMRGDDRVRHCSDCKLNVYNLSALSEEVATKLVEETEGRRCVRFFRRADGTLLTQNCPGDLGIPNIPRERLNAVFYTLAFVGLWAAMAPVGDAAWNVAGRTLQSATHAISKMVGPSDGGSWVAGEMEMPEDDGTWTTGIVAIPDDAVVELPMLTPTIDS